MTLARLVAEVGAHAADPDRHRVEHLRDRWAQLRDRDVDRLDTGERQRRLGGAISEPLEEHVLGFANCVGDSAGDLAVVDGVGELVRGTGRAEVDGQGEVDANRLGLFPLHGQRADDGVDDEVRDLDGVESISRGHGGTSGFCWFEHRRRLRPSAERGDHRVAEHAGRVGDLLHRTE